MRALPVRIFLIALFFSYLGGVCCQEKDPVSSIDHYCDSIDFLTNLQEVTLPGQYTDLLYLISNGKILKVVEKPVGYRYIRATINYYLSENQVVFANAGLDISEEEGGHLIEEFHRIYFSSGEVILNLISEKTYQADSLVRSIDNLTEIGEILKEDAHFIETPVDPELKEKILNAVEIFIEAERDKKTKNLLENYSSPFI